MCLYFSNSSNLTVHVLMLGKDGTLWDGYFVESYVTHTIFTFHVETMIEDKSSGQLG